MAGHIEAEAAQRGLTLAQVGEAAGVPALPSILATNPGGLDIEHLPAIADALDTTAADLLARAEALAPLPSPAWASSVRPLWLSFADAPEVIVTASVTVPGGMSVDVEQWCAHDGQAWQAETPTICVIGAGERAIDDLTPAAALDLAAAIVKAADFLAQLKGEQ